MGRAPRRDVKEEAPPGMPLPDPKKSLKAYYAGARLESPMGGYLEVLGVHSEDDGSARVILECSASSLRFELPIKRATRTEKAKVKKSLEEGRDPSCPRHGEDQRLARVGAYLVCAPCGVRFGKAD